MIRQVCCGDEACRNKCNIHNDNGIEIDTGGLVKSSHELDHNISKAKRTINLVDRSCRGPVNICLCEAHIIIKDVKPSNWAKRWDGRKATNERTRN